MKFKTKTERPASLPNRLCKRQSPR